MPTDTTGSASAPSPPSSGPEGAETVRHPLLASVLVALAYLAVALALLPQYGPSWDCVHGEYPYGDRMVASVESGERSYLDASDRSARPDVRAPHIAVEPPGFDWYKVRLLGSLLSGVSCRILWTELGWTSSLSAHNLPAVLCFAALLFGLSAFAHRRMGSVAAVAAGVLLVLAPRFFAHGFSNLKDLPEAMLYSLALLVAYGAWRGGRPRAWLGAGVLAGLALAQKENALFLPVHWGIFWLAALAVCPGSRAPSERARRPWLGAALLAAGFVIGHWGPFPPMWERPLAAPWERIREMMRFADVGMGGPLLAEFERWSRVSTRVSTHGVEHFLLSTPPIHLALAAVGLASRVLPARLRLFLALGVIVPVGRTLLPGMRNFDGVRHFLEVYPFLCLAAGAGFAALWSRLLPRLCARAASIRGVLPAARGALAALLAAPLLVQLVRTHPYGTCYYNAFAGGLAGAQERYAATDYWANSYWHGLAWLGEEAEPGAGVHVPFGEHVVRAAAPLRLRPDLALVRPDAGRDPLYVMYVTRSAAYGPLLRDLARQPAAFEIRVQGGPILRIQRFSGAERERVAGIYREEQRERSARRAMIAWLRENPSLADPVRRILVRAGRLGAEEAERRLRELLPPGAHPWVPDVVRSKVARRERRRRSGGGRRRLRPGILPRSSG